MSLVIHDATPADAEVCVQIYAHYVLNTTVTFELEVPDAAEMARRIAAAQQRHVWLIAERDGQVIGYASAGQFRVRAAFLHSAETAIYLREDARGHGDGSALYTELLARLAQLGHHRAIAVVTVPNKASAQLQKKLGFRYAGTLTEVGYKFDRWLDIQYYEKSLA